MFLTFDKDKFIAINCNERLSTKLALSRAWTPGNGGFYTTDIQAAAKLRPIADEHAERVFNKAFVKFYDGPSSPLPPFLDPHQIEGVNWVLTRSRSYLAHAPGAGKTAQAVVAALLSEGPPKVLFVVPPTLTVNWAREIMKWTEWADLFPTISIIPDSTGQDAAGWDAEYIILPDSMLTKLWVLEYLARLKFRLLAVDEASRFKESTSQRTIALFGGTFVSKKKKIKTKGLIHQAKHAVLLDGSPMPNRAMELWAPTYAMNPESIDFMSQTDFGFRYCGAKMNNFGQWQFRGTTHHEELHERLQKNFMHVVPESALNHPERRRSMIFVNEEVRSVEQKTWEHRHLKHLNFSDIDEDMSDGDLARFRRELGLNKVPFVAKYVGEKIALGESVLLFAWHREVCWRLKKAFHKMRPGIIMGGTLPSEREHYLKRFQEGKDKLLILNIGAGGRGHNIQRADRVVFGEFSFTDELNKQCEKRASRKGNDKAFTPCDYIVAPNSLDEPILNAVFTKAKNVRRVIG